MENQFQFKPFDQVLVRDYDNDHWSATYYSHFDELQTRHYCGCCYWIQCIPYNEETAHLIGTDKPYKKPEPTEWTVKTEEDQIQTFTHDEFLKLIENIKKDKSECILTFGYTGVENSN